mgnify:FL=1
MSDDIQAKVMTYIRSHYMIPEDDAKFTADVSLFDAGYIDSFGVNDLIAWFESEFKVTVEDKDISQGALDSITHMVAMIRKKQG